MSPHDIHQLADWLSARDLAILRSVADHRFLTVRQIEALHFADHTPQSGARIARRTMARLREYRLLGTLERSIGGVRAGSSGLVHYLDGVGDQVLTGRSGRQAHRQSRQPSSRFLEHRLAVADTHVALAQAAQRQTLELVSCVVEPATWRHYTGAGGARLILKPDLSADTAVPPGNDLLRAWFIEVDRGHEGLTTLLKKCHAYEAYRRSGQEQDRAGGFPVVIWSMDLRTPEIAARRPQALQEAIAADPTLPNELFRIVAPQQLIGLIVAGGQQ